MASQSYTTPVYRQFIGFIEKGYAALTIEHQQEVRKFIQSCQHRDGLFTDRAGTPDYYYSLFGTWLSLGVGLIHTRKDLEQHPPQQKENFKNPIDEFASLLIKASITKGSFKKPSNLFLLKKLFLRKGPVSIYYRFFLFVLIVDATCRKRRLYLPARVIMVFISPPAGAPCSIQAAYTTVRHKSGLDVNKEQKVLFDFFVREKGFKTFMDLEEVDMLSTAVALFALRTTGADLRAIAPDCLNFIQENYCNGAFLAGNGDKARDLEYTFYGLLALGILT